MAKMKKQTAPQSGGDKIAGNGAAISKVDALMEAVQQLGPDANNKDLGEYVRSKYGEQALPGNFSVTKSAVMKKLRQGNGRRGRRGGRQAAGRPSSSAPTGRGISLEDLREIKVLAGRYGKEQIKGVVDLLA